MCDYDAEEAEVWVVRHYTARRPHVCATCGSSIRRGEAYRVVSYGWDGPSCSERQCACCVLVSNEFREHHGQEPSPGWLWECVRDCHRGADRRDPDAAKWRRADAGIRWRNRAARRAEP